MNITMTSSKDECIICLDPLNEGLCYRLECNHIIHKSCFQTYVEYKYDVENNTLLCPVCQQSLDVQRVESLHLKIPNVISSVCCVVLSILICTNMVYIAVHYWF